MRAVSPEKAHDTDRSMHVAGPGVSVCVLFVCFSVRSPCVRRPAGASPPCLLIIYPFCPLQSCSVLLCSGSHLSDPSLPAPCYCISQWRI